MDKATKIEELTDRFRKIGAPDPEGWARSEVEEGIPQLARYLFLRQAWRNVISEDDFQWIAAYTSAAKSNPDEPFAGIGHALKRLKALGAADQDITDVVRGMQVELMFQILYLLEDPGMVEPEVADVSWALMETDDAGTIRGQLTGLHESVLGMDPTEREMRPRPGSEGEQVSLPPREAKAARRPRSRDLLKSAAKATVSFYSVFQSNGYELCHPVDVKFRYISSQLKGESCSATWKPPAMELIHEDEGRRLKVSDSPWFGSDSLIFRPRAIEVLGSLLRENGELLPLLCPEADLSIFNVTRVLDALDEEASTILRFEGGNIMWIKKHVFRKAVVQGADIFKITRVRTSEVFVGDRFVQRWKSEGLKGLEFKQVWSAD